MAILREIGEVIRTRYYAITHDLEIQEVKAIDYSTRNEVQYWVVEYYGKHFQPPHWRRYQYEIFDSQGNVTSKFSNKGWTLVCIDTIGDSGSVIFRGADPKGRVIYKGMDKQIKGVVKAISFLEELSHFASWEEYQLRKENEELRKTLDILLEAKNSLVSLLKDTK